MKHLKRFNEDMEEFEYDWDYIDEILHDKHGWGTRISLTNLDDFMNSKFFTNSENNDTTAEEFNSYLYAIQTGQLNDSEEE